MTSKSKNVVTLAVLAAMVFLSIVLDRYVSAFLPIGFAVITLTVTFSFGLIHDIPWITLSCGAVFGVLAWLGAVMTGVEGFINPLVSLVPRLLIGPVVFGVYRLLRYCLRKNSFRLRESVAIGTASALGAITNTVTVLSALVLFGGSTFTGDALKLLILANALPETVCSALLVPVIVLRVRRALHIKPKVYPLTKKETVSV